MLQWRSGWVSLVAGCFRGPTQGYRRSPWIWSLLILLGSWSGELILAPAQPVLSQVTSPPTQVRPLLKVGSQGTEVTELQSTLKLLGFYAGTVDGIYGESTAIAVAEFQEAAGLTRSGLVNAATWNRLFPTPTTVTPATGTPTTTPATAAPRPQTTTAPRPSPSPSPIGSTRPPATTVNPATNPAANPTRPTSEATQPNGAPLVVEFPVLKLGMRGPAILSLQERLRSLGFFKGTTDGIFGPETQTAVQAAQRNYRLTADGVVGTATWAVLMRN